MGWPIQPASQGTPQPCFPSNTWAAIVICPREKIVQNQLNYGQSHLKLLFYELACNNSHGSASHKPSSVSGLYCLDLAVLKIKVSNSTFLKLLTFYLLLLWSINLSHVTSCGWVGLLLCSFLENKDACNPNLSDPCLGQLFYSFQTLLYPFASAQKCYVSMPYSPKTDPSSYHPYSSDFILEAALHPIWEHFYTSASTGHFFLTPFTTSDSCTTVGNTKASSFKWIGVEI